MVARGPGSIFAWGVELIHQLSIYPDTVIPQIGQELWQLGEGPAVQYQQEGLPPAATNSTALAAQARKYPCSTSTAILSYWNH